MSVVRSIDFIPTPLLGLGIVAVLAMVVEVGFWLGRKWEGKPGLSRYPVEAATMTAVLGLFGFLIAFAFGSSASRYAKGRELALEDASAIETAYLRTGLLSDARQRQEVRALLLAYLKLRVEAVAANDPEAVGDALSRSDRLRQDLWQLAPEVEVASDDSNTRVIFLSSINQLFDTANRREWTGLYTRFPRILWVTLAFLGSLCALMVGLSAGLHGRSSRFATTALLVSFSVVIVLIVDLDRPFRSLIKSGADPNAAVLRKLLDQEAKAPAPGGSRPGPDQPGG